jgi:hypothetical protein
MQNQDSMQLYAYEYVTRKTAGRIFLLTSFAANSKLLSHTGFDGCDAVEPDSPMYITLPKNREA